MPAGDRVVGGMRVEETPTTEEETLSGEVEQKPATDRGLAIRRVPDRAACRDAATHRRDEGRGGCHHGPGRTGNARPLPPRFARLRPVALDELR